MQKPELKLDKKSPHDLVAEVFSLNRDIEVVNPYHLDGDIDMYNQENVKLRKQLAQDPDIQKQIQEIVKLYKFNQEGKLMEQNYKFMQREIALILRPDIEKDELNFIVDQDWQLDQKDGYIPKDSLPQKLYELVDVWSIGASKQQYISFIRILKKKLDRAIKIKQ